MKIPPEHLRIRLYGTFRDPDVWVESGLYSFHLLRDNYLIKPDYKLLDLACGAGRVALPMISFLDPMKGAYYGLDVDKEMMDWCSVNLKFPNFKFDWADVKNSQYFPVGTQTDVNYRFPYLDNLIDFGCAFSLFTHLLEPGAQNYLNEISRVLKITGQFMLSCFLFDAKTEVDIAAGKAAWTFKFSHSPRCRYDIEISPESTVGYTLAGFEEMVDKADMKIVNITRGDWSEVPHGRHDEVLLAQK